MICFLDMDGILTEFMTAALKLHGKEYPWNDPAKHGQFELTDLLGMAKKDFWTPLRYDFWFNLEWTTDGRDILRLAESNFSEVCLLTSPTATNQAECIAAKIDWVEKHIPRYKRKMLVGPPKHFCAHGNAMLIDDADHNVNAFRKAGGQACLYPRHWNSNHDLSTDALNCLKRVLSS